MAYHLLADATMVLHFAFLAYLVAGGFLAWRWPWAMWPHLLAAGWGLSTLAFHQHCPLTWLEDWARRRAGGSGLRHGFIDTYLTGIVYPERYTGLLQLLAALIVAVSWLHVLRRAHHPGAGAGEPTPRYPAGYQGAGSGSGGSRRRNASSSSENGSRST